VLFIMLLPVRLTILWWLKIPAPYMGLLTVNKTIIQFRLTLVNEL